MEKTVGLQNEPKMAHRVEGMLIILASFSSEYFINTKELI